MDDKERINLLMDLDLDGVKGLVKRLVMDAQFFRAFSKSPRQVIEREFAAIGALFPEGYAFDDFVETVRNVRKYFSRRKQDLSVFDDIIHVCAHGTVTVRFTERGREINFDNSVRQDYKFQQMTETYRGMEKQRTFGQKVDTSENMGQAAGRAYSTKGLSIVIARDFGPLIDPEVMIVPKNGGK